MADDKPRASAREALKVWLQFLALLVGLAVFCIVIYEIRRTL